MLNPLEEQLIRHYQFDSDLDVNIYVLRENIKRITNILSEKYEWFSTLSEVRKEVLINLSYFVGVENLTTEFHQMMFAIKHEHWDVAADFLVNSSWGKKSMGRVIELSEQLLIGERKYE